MSGAVLERVRAALRSRTLRLSTGLVMLTLSLLLAADLAGLREDGTEARQDAREAVAETLAVRLSLLAGAAAPLVVERAIETFVESHADVESATLRRTDGTERAFGAGSSDPVLGGGVALSPVRVPILDGERPWGELTVMFRAIDVVGEELRYLAGVAVLLLLGYLAYLGKLLVQLDPRRAIPERVDSAFNMLVEGVVVLDEHLRILMVNRPAAEIGGERAETLIGTRLDDWEWVREGRWQAPWTTVLETGLSITDHPVRLGAEEPRSYTVNCSPIRDDDGRASGVMVTLTDLSVLERKNRELAGTLTKLRRSQEAIARKNRELEALASQDPLTGLKNRRAVVEFFDERVDEARSRERTLSCVMVDIDHFKRINDTLGHAAGDEVICAVASVLVEQCREQDAVGRIGGEEFVVVLPDTTLEQATLAAERVRASIERLADDVNVPVDKLTASVGVAALEQGVATTEALLERADRALYAAKRGGRNRVEAYDPTRAGDDSEAGSADARTASAREIELERLLERKSRELDTIRTFEPLTGAPRTDVFVERVGRAMTEARGGGGAFGVLSVGLHDEARLASTLGRSGSERLLREFAARLRDGLRHADLVFEIVDDHRVSHLGTAEFGVLLGDVEEPSEALTVTTRIQRLFATPIVVDDMRVHVSCLVGAAFFPGDAESAEELIVQAAQARASAAGRPGRTSLGLVDRPGGRDARDLLELESDLHDALEQGVLSVQYQPKFELARQRVAGVEALVRWQHPSRGWVSPAQFVPLAERSGLIDELSAFVVRSSLADLRRWQERGFDELRLSMNVSAAQLRTPTLVSGLLEAIERAGVGSESVEVELTETAVIESPQRARIALGQLRDAGVSVSMDDFGVGYTSLALLADLPLDAVKIDRSFVGAMTDSDRGRAIVRSIVDMAHSLDLSVVGEGVETVEQLAALAELGCDEVQGYLISRPLDPEALEAFLRRQERESLERRHA